MFLSNAQVEHFLKIGLAVDGSNGGLIIGPAHSEGGIDLFWDTDKGFTHNAEVEGWEYFLNPGASAYYQNTFKEINNHQQDKTDSFDEYSFLPNIRVIDCRIKPELSSSGRKAKIIILRGAPQSICNKYSTKLHLKKLNDMNRGVGFKYDIDTPLTARRLFAIQMDNQQVIEEFQLHR